MAIDINLTSATPPCGAGKRGFSGTATENGVSVRFWSCASYPSFDFCHSKIWKDAGGPMTEVRAPEGATSLEIWLADIKAIAENDTEANRAAISTGAKRHVGKNG